VLLSIVFLFFVLDATMLNRTFITYLLQTDTRWPAGASDQFERTTLSDDDLTEYMDIRFIAQRTQVVGKFVYFPFLIFGLLIVSRISLFDNWEWPAGLVIVLAANFTLATVAAMMLRRAAERARANALKRLRERRMGYVYNAKPEQAAVLSDLISEVESEQTGAFSILSQYPWLAAVLLPSSGIGLWAILEYVARSSGGGS
jgi:hypothetical protein